MRMSLGLLALAEFSGALGLEQAESKVKKSAKMKACLDNESMRYSYQSSFLFQFIKKLPAPRWCGKFHRRRIYTQEREFHL